MRAVSSIKSTEFTDEIVFALKGRAAETEDVRKERIKLLRPGLMARPLLKIVLAVLMVFGLSLTELDRSGFTAATGKPGNGRKIFAANVRRLRLAV